MITVFTFFKIHKPRIVVGALFAFVISALHLFLAQELTGISAIDWPLRLVSSVVFPLASISIILIAGITLAIRSFGYHTNPKAFSRFAMPHYEPLARTRMPKDLKNKLLVNRKEEVEFIQDLTTGETRVLVITGEPGIGKSSVAAVIARRIDFWLNLTGKRLELRYLFHQLAEWVNDQSSLDAAKSRDNISEKQIQRLAKLIARGERRLFFNGFELLLTDDGKLIDRNVGQLMRALCSTEGDQLVVMISSEAVDSEELGANSFSLLELEGLESEHGGTILSESLESKWDSFRLEVISDSAGGNPLLLKLMAEAVESDTDDNIDLRKPWKNPTGTPFLNPSFLASLAGEGLEILQRVALFPEPLTESFVASLADENVDGHKITAELKANGLLEWDGGMKKFVQHPVIAASAFASVVKDSDKISTARSRAIDTCLVKAEDFKSRKYWQTINDCRMLVRAVDLFIEEGMLHKAETLLTDIQPELMEWGYFALVDEFYRRLLPVIFRKSMAAPANRASLLNILKNYAALCSTAGDHSGSADVYSALRFAARRFREESALLLATGKLTEELRESDSHQRAISVARQHLKHAIDSANPVIIAAAHGRLGHAYLEAGDGRSAEEQYYNALELFRANDNHKGEATVVGYLAKLYSSAGYYEDAISLLVSRLEITGDIGDEDARYQALFDLSRVHLQAGENQKAITVLEQLVASSESAGNLKIASEGLSAIARIAFASRDYAQVIMRQSERLSIAEKMKDDRMAGNALGHIGHAYNRMMDRGKAIEHYTLAEMRFSSDSYLAGMAKCRHYVARLYGAEKQWDMALKNVLKSIDLKLLSGDDNIDYDLKVLNLCRHNLGEDEYNMLAAREIGENRLAQIESIATG